MPELLEVEYYRRLAERVVGRRIAAVHAPDAWYLRGGLTAGVLTPLLRGAVVLRTGRRGKLLLLELDRDAVLGLRFGMTGRLVVDGVAAIDKLEYSTARRDPRWERFALRFAGGGDLVMIDPRRLGGVELDPSLDALGPDAASIGPAGLGAALSGAVALKARLLDQGRLAGLGNLLVDEILWRAHLDPTRAAGGLDPAERRRLHRVLRRTLAELDAKGGSHTGDLFVARDRAAGCPRCGRPLARDTVGGRTTVWCPAEQR